MTLNQSQNLVTVEQGLGIVERGLVIIERGLGIIEWDLVIIEQSHQIIERGLVIIEWDLVIIEQSLEQGLVIAVVVCPVEFRSNHLDLQNIRKIITHILYTLLLLLIAVLNLAFLATTIIFANNSTRK